MKESCEKIEDRIIPDVLKNPKSNKMHSLKNSVFSFYLLVFSLKSFYLLIFSFYIIICSCRRERDYLEEALRLAGNNRPELEKVLAHYGKNQEDSLKYKAAVFLIENMPWHHYPEHPGRADYYLQIDSIFAIKEKTKSQIKSLIDQIKIDTKQMEMIPDIRSIRAPFLISQIDHAFETRRYPWAKSLTFNDFCEYVLPYRLDKEPLEDWRPLYEQLMATMLDSLAAIGASDSIVCKSLMSLFDVPPGFVLMEGRFPLPLKPTLYLNMNTASCHDLTLYTQFVMRTAGLPVNYDFTPQWANRILGHDWNSIFIDGKTVTFQLFDWVPFGRHLPSKVNDKMAKAYRRMYSIQKESLILQPLKEEIPPQFRDPFIRDVSEFYFDPVDIEVDLTIPFSGRKQIAYIMVFNNKDWSPVAWGTIQNKRALFKKMNKDCAYLAMYYDNGVFHPASDPFYIDKSGKKRILSPRSDKMEKVSLVRKHPYFDMKVIREMMPGGKFQLANRSDFSDAVTIHVIDTLQAMIPHFIRMDDAIACNYFRYLSSDKGFVFMAEMEVYDEKGQKLTGKIIGTDGSAGNSGRDKTKVFDGDMLTYFDAPVISGGWVGLKFSKKEKIKEIKYIPRNDDNHININELYELFYYDRGWISLGTRTGDITHVLNYDNVPENALLWLRNHTKGREERIFTYENGKQSWW